jgi:hypothetical protein
MGWAVGYDSTWRRDIGYGVPAICDHPGCGADIDRGLAFVCGSNPYGEPYGCGLYFCSEHLWMTDRGERDCPQLCDRCRHKRPPFEPTPDTAEWTNWKLTDPSWAQWRADNGITTGRDEHVG